MLIAFSFNISSETYLKCDSGKKKFSVEKLLNDQIKVKKIKPRTGKYKESDGVYARAEPHGQGIFFYLIVLGDGTKGERVDLLEGVDKNFPPDSLQELLEEIRDDRSSPAPENKKKICSYYLGHTNKVPPFREFWGEDQEYYKEDDNCHEWDISTQKYKFFPSYDVRLELDRERLRLHFTYNEFLGSYGSYQHSGHCSISTKDEHEKIKQKYQDFLAPFKKAEVQSLKEMEEDIKDNQKI
jgi:hypothetical protein